MTTIRNAGALVSVGARPPSNPALASLRLYDNLSFDYASIYKTQPEVRTCVSFLARNIASLNPKLYQRVSDIKRSHLQDHGLATVLRRPNQFHTRYSWLFALVADIAVFDMALWMKVPDTEGGPFGLMRIPPQFVEPLGSFAGATSFRLFGDAKFVYGRDEVAYFRGYNPDSDGVGLPTPESLRRILAESAAAGETREAFWRNHARLDGVLEADSLLTDETYERMRKQWKALYSGAKNTGETALLEGGVHFKPLTMNAKDAEYIAARKLSREEVAAAYHIPPPMVGILEHATYSNITEQGKMLYRDTFGPWLRMIEDELQAQLLPDFEPTEGVYVEFNLEEKLKGSFEEQTAVLSAAVGRPYMTPDEARARLNLPQLGGSANELGPAPNAPGEAQVVDAPKALESKAAAVERGYTKRRRKHAAKHAEEIAAYFKRQGSAAVSKLGAGKAAGTVLNWKQENEKLEALLYGLSMVAAQDFGEALAKKLGSGFAVEGVTKYLQAEAAGSAASINATTKAALTSNIDEVRHLYDVATTSRAAQIAEKRATFLGNFGRVEAAQQAGKKTKTWTVVSGKSRHPEMSGETVKIGEDFSNGCAFPGAGSVDESAGCQCLVTFG